MRFLARALVIALSSVLLSAASAMAQTQTPSPSPTATGVASVKPGPPAPYYAAWGLIVIAGITVIAVLGAYLYHAPGFRQRHGRGTAG